jgi:hemerythrin
MKIITYKKTGVSCLQERWRRTMAIEWQEELATGIEHIDEQHKGIFARFAEFTTACNDGCANVELVNLMGFLEEYARNHFRDEEKAMLEAEYPDLSIHGKAINRF